MTSPDRVDVAIMLPAGLIRLDAWGETFNTADNSPAGRGRTAALLSADQAMALSRMLAKHALQAGYQECDLA